MLCAADEVAVELFLNIRISFPDIARVIARTISLHQGVASPTLDDILAADSWARETAHKIAEEESLCYQQ